MVLGEENPACNSKMENNNVVADKYLDLKQDLFCNVTVFVIYLLLIWISLVFNKLFLADLKFPIEAIFPLPNNRTCVLRTGAAQHYTLYK